MSKPSNVAKFNGNPLTRNPGGFEHPEQKVEFLLSIRGILKKVFGDLHDYLFYDKEAEFCLLTLRETFGFKDVDEIFPRVVNEKKTMAYLETIMRFAKSEGQGTEIR